MTNQATDEERADAVRAAQELMFEAIEKVEWAIRGHPCEDNVDAYVLAHMKILASSGHGYVTRDQTLDDVIRKLDPRGDDEDYE